MARQLCFLKLAFNPAEVNRKGAMRTFGVKGLVQRTMSTGSELELTVWNSAFSAGGGDASMDE